MTLGDDPLMRFRGRDGREMVMVPADIYDRLRELAAQALQALPPADVAAAIAGGAHPLAAWRRHRGLSQHALAARAGVSRVWISRIEMGAGHGTPATRLKLAAALEVAVGALEVIDLSPRT
ncbi:helix-turn-helix domain-containing protein [Sphingomonas prati]|uniref:DNA-binding XRE family transcriptional regulator n=1 Tax=Sphingomonas prati TaxID=1843237 RepID=A0A7W9BV36_9SPHN|nr:helix-turn-helix transcriptional regulator [Sphingomonas prati]MBB5730223.1 DNA-binding XRE family transcriptional regulator [Sphingomonas prati]GGE92516.1 hypothetical protein GCM10011404_26760 [Sphingomonas prati]